MKCIRTQIIGWGHCLPKKIMTNDDMAKIVETSDEWISTRTGIKKRHIAEGENETTAQLAAQAAQKALLKADLNAADLDLIVVGTITPDNTTPSTAAKIAKILGCRAGMPCFDLSAACSGFVYALTMADNMIRLGQVQKALVIGAETLSKIVDWQDRNTCVLFGDGAGAVVLQAGEGYGTAHDCGILATKLYADGSQFNHLLTNGGVSTTANSGFLVMDGKEVFKSAVGCLAEAAEYVMQQAGVSAADVDWLVPHQANIRIIDGVGHKLGIETQKVAVTLDHHGNTSAASIPLALSECLDSGKIKKGDLVVLTAMGAGFTWGGALIRI